MKKSGISLATVAPVDEVQETKAEKFVRLADYRTLRVIHYMNSIGKLVSPAYEHTPEQANAIINAIAAELADLSNRLLGIKEEKKPFSLRDCS